MRRSIGLIPFVLLLVGIFAAVSIAAEGADAGPRLVEAVRNGDATALRALLKLNGDPDTTETAPGGDYGVPLLTLAVERENADIVAALLEAGADVDKGATFRGTPLRAAVKTGNPGIVEMLLDAGANPWPDYFPVIHFARDARTARQILDREADPETRKKWVENSLLVAAADADGETIGLLVEAGADLRASELFRIVPLHLAAEMNPKEDAVRALLEAGAEVDAATEHGWTALMYAAKDNTAEIVRLLIESGALVNAASAATGETPLMLAAIAGKVPVVETLLAAGADVEARDKWGRTALTLAAIAGRVSSVTALLKKGADIDSRDDNGLTPLRWAVDFGRRNVAKRLLAAGADDGVGDESRLNSAGQEWADAIADLRREPILD